MIKQEKFAGFDVIVITEESSNSKAILCPERGGILLQLTLFGEEVFYLQEETFADVSKNIRGGNPVLFPICGPLPNDEYELDGVTYKMKQHGFARNKVWKTDSISGQKVTLSLQADEETLQQYPYYFQLKFTYELTDGKLHIYQTYANLGEGAMPFFAGFHPYFSGNHILSKYNIPSSQYFDYEDFTIKKRTCATSQLEISDSKVFLHLSDSMISFKGEAYTMNINYSEHFKYAVLWSESPEEYICLEPWMARAGSFTNNNGVIELAPGEQVEAHCSFFIEKP